MSSDAVGSVWHDDVPPVPDHLRILDALEKNNRAGESCYRSFGMRRYYRAARSKVRYPEIRQEVFPSEAVARRLVRARRLKQWAFRKAYGTKHSE